MSERPKPLAPANPRLPVQLDHYSAADVAARANTRARWASDLLDAHGVPALGRNPLEQERPSLVEEMLRAFGWRI